MDDLEVQPTEATICYVSGKAVGVRSGPSTKNPIIDRFDTWRMVFLLEQARDWSKIRDDLTQHDGCIATRFLVESKTKSTAAPAEVGKKPEEIEVESAAAADGA